MQAKLEGLTSHSVIQNTSNSIAQLQEIKSMVFQFQKLNHSCLALYLAKRKLCTISHGSTSTCEYFDRLKNIVEVIQTNSGDIGTNTEFIKL